MFFLWRHSTSFQLCWCLGVGFHCVTLWDQISILIMGCVTTWSRGSHHVWIKLWAFQFRVFGSVLSGSHISPHKGSIRVNFSRTILTHLTKILEPCWWISLLNFLVLTYESDSYSLQFLNELNLTYRRLTSFLASFYSFQ